MEKYLVVPKHGETHVFLKYSADYADEFDVQGCGVQTIEDWNEFVKEAYAEKYPKECWFGTNEAIELYSAEDVLRNFKIQLVSEVEANILIKYLRDYEYSTHAWFGFFPDLN